MADTLRDWIFGHPSNPFRAKGFIPPRNAFTRSLAYHASGGARRVESSANNNPFWPVGWLLSVLHTPSQHPVLQFAFGFPPHGPFICPSNGRTAQSVPPLGTPFFFFLLSPLPPPPHLPRYFSDYGNLVIRGTDGGPRPPPIILELFLSRGGCVWFASKICPKFLNIFRRLFDEYLALHIEINN